MNFQKLEGAALALRLSDRWARLSSRALAKWRYKRSWVKPGGDLSYRFFFFVGLTSTPALSSSLMNRTPAFSNAASIRIIVET
jgi:hypothetical protein